ncbi:MAG: DUF4260 domain-containing protein [Flavobacteriales bacterium]|nr:MAG: DUF4260 domain-containing protein [Flavobacteriales bacterium]
MKTLLKLEEAAQFLICLVLLTLFNAPWWNYPLLLIGPDVGMLGYLVSPRVGAFSYNLLHHKGVAIAFLLIALPQIFGVWHPISWWMNELDLFIAGIILYGHASMDRIFGYGLKFGDNFHHTHLGWIGKMKDQERS